MILITCLLQLVFTKPIELFVQAISTLPDCTKPLKTKLSSAYVSITLSTQRYAKLLAIEYQPSKTIPKYLVKQHVFLIPTQFIIRVYQVKIIADNVL